MRTIARFVCVTLLTIASSVQAQSGLPPGTWRIADAPPELRPAATEGDLVVISLQDALLRELSRTLEAGGPPLPSSRATSTWPESFSASGAPGTSKLDERAIDCAIRRMRRSPGRHRWSRRMPAVRRRTSAAMSSTSATRSDCFDPSRIGRFARRAMAGRTRSRRKSNML